MFTLGFFSAVLNIVIIDLVLSGDNSLIIAMASRKLPPKQRKQAIFWGAFGAIGLRVTFTAAVAMLLAVPLLRAVGGLILIWIAVKLLKHDAEDTSKISAQENLWRAVKTIVVADVIMSLDNILAVGGASHGNIPLLLFGLFLSMMIIMWGSQLVANLMNKWPILILVGAGVLAWTAGNMIGHDEWLKTHLGAATDTLGQYLPPLVLAGVLIYGWRLARQVRAESRHAKAMEAAAAHEKPAADAKHTPEASAHH